MRRKEEYNGVDHDDDLQHGSKVDTEGEYPAVEQPHNVQYTTKMGLATKLVMVDRVLFSFMILPALYIGLTDGFRVAAIFVTVVIVLRLLIQVAIRKRIKYANTVMPLRLRRESTDIMAFFAIITLGISLDEGSLDGLIKVVIALGITYLAIVIICTVTNKRDRNQHY